MGWISLHRKLFNWSYYYDLKHQAVWIRMLLEANYTASDFQGEKIGVGELVFTYRTWVAKLANCRPQISKQNLETIIKHLKKSGQITTRRASDRATTIIRIVNYTEYQNVEMHSIKPEKIKTPTQGELRHQTPKIKTPTKTRQDAQQTPEMPDIKETQLGMCFGQDKNQDSNQERNPKNQDSDAMGAKTTIINYKNKLNNINNKKKKSSLSSHEKKYSKVFLGLAETVLCEINDKLGIAGMQKYDKNDACFDDEFLKPLQKTYRKQFKDQAQYKLVVDHMFFLWHGRQFPDGREMMSNFTPQTLFERNMGKYLRLAINHANRPIKGPKNGNHGECPSDLFAKALEFDEQMKKEMIEEDEKRQKEFVQDVNNSLEENNDDLKSGKILTLK